MSARERRAARGFTLIEAAIAFAVLAAGLAGLMGAVSDGIAAGGRSAAAERAASAARSALALVGTEIALAPAALAFDTPEGDRIELTVAPALAAEGNAPALWQVSARATPASDPRRAVTLVTLRVGEGG